MVLAGSPPETHPELGSLGQIGPVGFGFGFGIFLAVLVGVELRAGALPLAPLSQLFSHLLFLR
jgi:hypothetical protein